MTLIGDRVNDLLQSWFERMRDVPYSSPQGKLLLQCTMELGETLDPDFRQKIQVAIAEETASRRQDELDSKRDRKDDTTDWDGDLR